MDTTTEAIQTLYQVLAVVGFILGLGSYLVFYKKTKTFVGTCTAGILGASVMCALAAVFIDLANAAPTIAAVAQQQDPHSIVILVWSMLAATVLFLVISIIWILSRYHKNKKT